MAPGRSPRENRSSRTGRMGRHLRRRLERAPTLLMNVRYLIALLCLAFAPFVRAQVQLEKPNPPATETAPAPAPNATTAPAPAPTSSTDATTAPAPAPAPAPIFLPPPPPPEPPRAANPIGLLILAVILSHVCLPLGLLVGLILLLVVIKFFRGGLTKLVMGMAATGGGARAIRGVLVLIGCFIVLPSGFMGLNWASKWMDYRVAGPTWFFYGLVVSVLTGLVFFTLVRAIARALKKKFLGKMGGMMG